MAAIARATGFTNMRPSAIVFTFNSSGPHTPPWQVQRPVSVNLSSKAERTTFLGERLALRTERKLLADHTWSKSGRASCTLTGFQKMERTASLPLDYYQLLGAEDHFLADAVMRKFEARMAKPPPDVGFSDEALSVRAMILEAACTTLSDPVLRAEYNTGLMEDPDFITVDVPMAQVAGALLLLVEVGEVAIVVEVGDGLLKEKGAIERLQRRDVALAVALAYMDLSRGTLAKNADAVVTAYDLMENALELLKSEDLALQLQDEIADRLAELAPRCILQLLSLPLDAENEARRNEGLAGAREILWAASGSNILEDGSAGYSKESFMTEAFNFMTAAELVDLFQATPQHIPAEGTEVYAVALAHIAEGVSAKKPRLIQEADVLFGQLQQTLKSVAEAEGPGARSEASQVSLERGMVAMLLGKMEEAKFWLGVDVDPPVGDPKIVSEIFSNSPMKRPTGDDTGEDDPLLPGLCMVLQRWLNETVYQRFRDTREIGTFQLIDYFDDEGVRAFLDRIDKGSGEVAAAAIARSAGEAFSSLQNIAVNTLHKVFPGGPNDPSSPDMSTSTFPPSTYADDRIPPPYTEEPPFYRVPNGRGYAPPPPSVNGNGSVSWVPEPSTSGGGAMASLQGGAAVPEAGPLTGVPLGADSWRRAAGQGNMSGGRRSERSGNGWAPLALVGGAALLGALGFGMWRFGILGRGLPGGGGGTLRSHPAAAGLMGTSVSLERGSTTGAVEEREEATRVEDYSDDDAMVGVHMDVEKAEVLVRRWNNAKTLALGPTHDTSTLAGVLDGAMLEMWAERAQDWAKGGWYVEYKLLDVDVAGLKLSNDGTKAVAEVTLQESARLHDVSNPTHSDAYRSTYTTEYEFTFGPTGWRITGGNVLR